MTRFRTAALAATISAIALGAAEAHPKLKTATPAVGATVQGAPSEIRITFTEDLFARFSGAKVTDARGRAVRTGAAFVASDDKKQLVVPLKAKLVPGSYQVAWHAVSADTHRVHGSYTFLVN